MSQSRGNGLKQHYLYLWLGESTLYFRTVSVTMFTQFKFKFGIIAEWQVVIYNLLNY